MEDVVLQDHTADTDQTSQEKHKSAELDSPDALVLTDELGKGFFGKVYKGTYMGMQIAAKELEGQAADDDFLKLFEREVELLRKVNHRNVVQFLGILRQGFGDRRFIVMEYLPGGTLRQVIKNEQQRLPWTLRLSLLKDTALAMKYLHEQGIIHRDLKSKNLLLDKLWRVKVCDFGLARSYQTESDRPMTCCGTTYWMAPEILFGYPYDKTADVFSFGIVICEMITRIKPDPEILKRTPAFGLDEESLRSLVNTGCPETLISLALACCDRDVKTRPSWETILEQLDSVDADLEEREFHTRSKLFSSNVTAQMSNVTNGDSLPHAQPGGSASVSAPPSLAGGTETVEGLWIDGGELVPPEQGRQRPPGPVWVRDSDVTACQHCRATFTMFLRKHHCRMCGNVFCGECTSQRHEIPQFGCTVPVRVCSVCYHLLTTGSAKEKGAK